MQAYPGRSQKFPKQETMLSLATNTVHTGYVFTNMLYTFFFQLKRGVKYLQGLLM